MNNLALSQIPESVDLSAIGKDRRNRKAKTTEIPVDGLEEAAQQALDLKAVIESLEVDLERAQAVLRQAALAHLYQCEERGEVYKTCFIGPVQVTRANKHKALPPEEYKEIEALGLGGAFERKISARVKPAMIDQLLAVLGQDALNYIELSESYSVPSTWIEDRAALRPVLSLGQNETLDTITERYQYAWQVKARK